MLSVNIETHTFHFLRFTWKRQLINRDVDKRVRNFLVKHDKHDLTVKIKTSTLEELLIIIGKISL